MEISSAPSLKAEWLITCTQTGARTVPVDDRIWVEPKLLAEIEYRAKPAEGKVRHPFFKDCERICDLGWPATMRALLSQDKPPKRAYYYFSDETVTPF